MKVKPLQRKAELRDGKRPIPKDRNHFSLNSLKNFPLVP